MATQEPKKTSIPEDIQIETTGDLEAMDVSGEKVENDGRDWTDKEEKALV